ncbi:MAG: vWA domain-containing protein [Pseudomonadota bacterium]
MRLLLLALLLAWPTARAQSQAQPADQPAVRPSAANTAGVDSTRYRQVDACFVLDTTGSMSAAIQTAKEKVWYIANQIARSDARPRLRLCLMAYRDRDDSYVTRLSPLTEDVDHIHAKLSELSAGGGGDTPEAVHQALFETVQRAGWDSGDATLRVIFLIGDAPPKIYPDEPQYPEILAQANRQGVVINPVLIGNASDTRRSFEELESLGSGSLLHLPTGRDAPDPATPMDQDLVALSARLNATIVPYGNDLQQTDTLDHARETEDLGDGEQIERLAFGNASERVLHREGDLIQDLAEGRTQLNVLDARQLPASLRSMDADELSHALGEIRAERQALQSLIGQLLEQRRVLIEDQRSQHSFSAQVSQVLLRQL